MLRMRKNCCLSKEAKKKKERDDEEGEKQSQIAIKSFVAAHN